MSRYYSRIIDRKIPDYLDTFGALLIEGPKWCGKTTTASRHAKSILEMKDTSNIQHNLLVAGTAPALLLEGEKPRLIDEWQVAPVLWDAIRVDVDKKGMNGQYILTGSSSPPQEATMHTGTGRFARLAMKTLSLFESLDSSGDVSLAELSGKQSMVHCKSDRSIQDIAFLICRGGWPKSIGLPEKNALLTMREYVKAIFHHDMVEVGNVKIDPRRVELFLKSYARHIQTLAKNTTILEDMRGQVVDATMPTIYGYQDTLQRMFIIDEIPAWAPDIRSRTSIRTSNKRSFVDPAIATAILKLTPASLLSDFEYFGLLFESLCIRDLRIYAESMDAHVMHYRDRHGLECDAVIQLANGGFGLVEIKLGGVEEDKAADNLLRLESLLFEKKKPKPVFKMILTGGQYGYTRPDGVHVVPITCLRD